jgi:hypothetical protein
MIRQSEKMQMLAATKSSMMPTIVLGYGDSFLGGGDGGGGGTEGGGGGEGGGGEEGGGGGERGGEGGIGGGLGDGDGWGGNDGGGGWLGFGACHQLVCNCGAPFAVSKRMGSIKTQIVTARVAINTHTRTPLAVF